MKLELYTGCHTKKKKKKIHLPLKEILAMEVAKPLAVKPADLDSGLLLSQ